MLRRQAGARVVSSPDRPNCAAKASSSQPAAYFQYVVPDGRVIWTIRIKCCVQSPLCLPRCRSGVHRRSGVRAFNGGGAAPARHRESLMAAFLQPR